MSEIAYSSGGFLPEGIRINLGNDPKDTFISNDNVSVTIIRNAEEKALRVGASRDLPIAETERSWDDAAARRRIFELEQAQWRRAFLVYESESPELKDSYHLPFADVIDGELKAIPSGLRAAASRLPQTDAPQEVLDGARGVLNGYFRRMNEGRNTLKAVASSNADEFRVANYIVLFGGRDLEGTVNENVNADGSRGQFFTEKTRLDSAYTDTGRLYVDWEHGAGPWVDGMGPDENNVLGYVDWTTKAIDENGVWVERVLLRRARYMKEIEELINAGLIGNSSEAVGDGVSYGEDGEIKSWPLRRDTLTVSPMEPRMLTENAFRAAKALGLLPQDDEPEDAQENADGVSAPVESEAAVADGNGKTTTNSQTMEDETMDENENSVQIDYDRIEGAFTNALKASGLLDKPQPLGHVTQDEADNAASDPALKPYKHIGEQLLDVVAACRPGSPPPARLLAAHKATAKAVSGLSETVPADGGFLVQTDLQQQLLMPDHEMNKVLSRIPANRRIRISNNANGTTINGIDETSRATGSRWGGVRGYWLSEGDQKTGSKPKFRQINLKLNKVAALVYATDEVLADASQLRTVVGESAREELAFLTEDAIIEGTGAGMPQGILSSPGLVTVAKETGQAAATVVANNIIKMWARRWTRAMDYVWFINQDVTPQLHGLNLPVGTGGALVYMPAGGLSGLPYGTLYGAPVIEIEYASTLGTVGDVILASMGSYVLADKGDAQEASSMHVRFEYDEQVFRFVYRVDGQTANHSALTPFKGTNTVSPFVALATRA